MPEPLDLARRFLPESLARTAPLVFLGGGERRLLNQLRGRTYVAAAALAASFELGAPHRIAAPAAMGSLALLRGLAGELADALGAAPAELDRDGRIGAALGGGSPLAGALTSLHLGWAVQVHHAECAFDRQLEPRFRGVVEALWLAEADQLRRFAELARALAAAGPAGERLDAVDECLAGVERLDDLLAAALEHDLDAFGELTGRRLGGRERARARVVQRQAARWTHLGAGLTHPRFQALVAELAPQRAARLAALGEAFL